MALSLSKTYVSGSSVRHGCSTRYCPAVSRRPVVTVRAGLGDAFNFVGQAFVKIFSPPSDNGVSWSGTSNTFKGKISHEADRPFKDNYVAGGQKYSNAAAVADAEATSGDHDNEVMDYVGGALERVVGHNFTGDESEPAVGTGSAGWQGDLHDRKKDGFHNRRV